MENLINSFKKVKFLDTLISTIIAVTGTVFLYKFLYPILKYTNLTDFYVGTTIYSNHNKSLDIYIYFVYLALFFLILPFCTIFREKLLPYKKETESKNNTLQEKKFIPEKLYKFLLKIQYLFPLSFLLLNPPNGGFYPVIFAISIIIITISMIDIYKTNKSNNGFSIFSLTALLFFLSFGFVAPPSNIDFHHFGESYGTYYLHNVFNLEYYKDIMLVHGFIDVLPSQIGALVTGRNNIYCYSIGIILYSNLIFILTGLLNFKLFEKDKIFAIPFCIFALVERTFIQGIMPVYSLIYIFLTFKKLTDKYYLWVLLYIISAFLFLNYSTTLGTFWVISSFPLFIYVCFTYMKRGKKFAIFYPILIVSILLILFNKELIYFLQEAKEYTQGTLFAFGNNFYSNTHNILAYHLFLLRCFAYFFTPYLIIELIKQLKSKDTKKIFILLFFILFTIVSVKYTFGRIDNISLFRCDVLSSTYLLFVLPLYIFLFATNKIKRIFKTVIIITVCIVFFFPQIKKLPEKYTDIKKFYNTISPIVNEIDDTVYIQAIPDTYELINILSKKSNDSTYLDLTNGGLNYMFAKKKMPIKYVSFYNSITTNQANDSLQRISDNMPDYIGIPNDKIIIDDIYPSLRINPVYRKILLSNNYKLNVLEYNTILEKTNNDIYFNENDFYVLDNILANDNLEFLPEVWANSIKTLPINKLQNNIKMKKVSDTEYIINPKTPFNGKDIDFILLKSSSRDKSYTISINDSNIELKCKSNTGNLLIPIDNFPSWLLNKNIYEIKIISDSPFEIAEAEFYNKRVNIR